jgi:3-hydroxyacyl-CoA dehydrogenase
VRAIVVIGSGRTFIAGADVHEFQSPLPASMSRNPRVLSAIEDSAKPVVMAIQARLGRWP